MLISIVAAVEIKRKKPLNSFIYECWLGIESTDSQQQFRVACKGKRQQQQQQMIDTNCVCLFVGLQVIH